MEMSSYDRSFVPARRIWRESIHAQALNSDFAKDFLVSRASRLRAGEGVIVRAKRVRCRAWSAIVESVCLGSPPTATKSSKARLDHSLARRLSPKAGRRLPIAER